MGRGLFLAALLLLLTGCSVPEAVETAGQAELREPEETAALRVDGEDAPVWLCRYWLRRAEAQIEAEYQAAGSAPDWEAEGGSLRRCAERQAMADTALCLVVDAWAADWNCGLTVDDQTALDQLWAERAADYGGEEGYRAHLKEQGLSPEEARMLAETGQRYDKLHQSAQSGSHGPTQEELTEFSRQSGLLRVDRILIPKTGDSEAARTKAETLFASLNEQGADAFAALRDQGADPTGPRLLRADSGDFDPELVEAAACLAEGQYSGILEGQEGYSILLRLPVERDDLVSAWLDERLLSAAAQAKLEVLQAPKDD